jgi:hypothetical protein
LSANKYYFTHKGEQIEIEAVNTMKDLGVIFDSCLKFDQQIHEKNKQGLWHTWNN